MLLITVHPESVAPAIIESVDMVLAVGEAPDETIRAFCKAAGQQPPELESTALEKGEVLAWRHAESRPVRVRTAPSRSEHSRHSRKYAEGNLGPDRSFRFRGPDEKLNLRAQNLVVFLQMAEGVDEETWRYHLQQGDYSRWFREGVKDKDLAAEAGRVEKELRDAPASDSRAAIREAIEKRYTLPSEGPSGEVSAEESSVAS